jgi:mycothiol synthase
VTALLPDTYAARPPTPSDAEAILAVRIARDLADVGQPDWTLGDVRDEMAHPRVDLERDGLVVTDAAGEVVAFALLIGADARIAVHPDAERHGIGGFLSEQVERRARAAGAAMVRQEVMSANGEARSLLEAAGYEIEQHYWRMERVLDGGAPAPAWPAGIGVRLFERVGDDRAAYALVSAAMADIPGNTERTFEEWHSRALGESLAPELSTVAYAGDGSIAGIALCRRWDDGDGYVDYLAVAHQWRGRGLGRALLAASMRRFAGEGMRRAVLWVNGGNESATRLYRNAGMEVAFRADRYVKRLAA